MSLDGVSVSTFFAQSRFWDSDFSSLGLGLVFETQIFQSRSRSRHWDSDLFSLGLGLVIETQTFSVSVSVSMIQIWSRSSLIVATKTLPVNRLTATDCNNAACAYFLTMVVTYNKNCITLSSHLPTMSVTYQTILLEVWIVLNFF